MGTRSHDTRSLISLLLPTTSHTHTHSLTNTKEHKALQLKMKLIILLLPLLASQADAASENARCLHCGNAFHHGYYGDKARLSLYADTLCPNCCELRYHYMTLDSQRAPSQAAAADPTPRTDFWG